jgi:hypothetical protein
VSLGRQSGSTGTSAAQSAAKGNVVVKELVYYLTNHLSPPFSHLERGFTAVLLVRKVQ